MNPHKRRVLWAAAVVVALGFAGLYYQQTAVVARKQAQQQLQSQLHTALLVDASKQSLPPFALRDHHDQVFDNQRLVGRWSLLFFGYTHCPDVCPTELYQLSRLLDAMAEKKRALPQVFFISLDSLRDTPVSMQQYTRYFHPDFIGVTGEQSAVDALAAHFQVAYETVYYQGSNLIKVNKGEKIPPEQANSYLINHSASIYLINPQGQWRAVFPSPHQEADLLADLPLLAHE
jgi:protein SCO1/2